MCYCASPAASFPLLTPCGEHCRRRASSRWAAAICVACVIIPVLRELQRILGEAALAHATGPLGQKLVGAVFTHATGTIGGRVPEQGLLMAGRTCLKRSRHHRLLRSRGA
jgi:hypothetical protein